MDTKMAKAALENSHFLTNPMFQIFHVSIHPNKIDRDGELCRIRGFVHVVDQDGQTFDLYNRSETDPETVSSGGFLSLSASPVMPSKLLEVVVDLYDGSHGVEIANGCFEIDYSKPYEYDRVDIRHIKGEYGHASVCFATFQHAVIACLDKVELHHECGVDECGVLSRTISACFKRRFKNSGGDVNGDEFPRVTLFRHWHDNAEGYSPSGIKFAVPFYCSLAIEADFDGMSDDTRIVMDIQPDNAYSQSFNKASLPNHDCEMHVNVTWLDCFYHFNHNSVIVKQETQENKNETEPKSQLSSEDEKYLKLCAEVSKVLMKEGATSRRQLCSAIPVLSSCVEVFSVLIFTEENDLYVDGTVEIEDSGHTPFYVFNGRQTLCDNRTLAISGPLRSFNDRPFRLRINLNDQKGRSVSRGSICWNGSDDSSISFYERHLCSVIPGDIGYAAVHYSLFSYGNQVRIRVVFKLQRDSGRYINVHGTITATYGNHRYPTLYDQENYRITLFSRREDEPVTVELSKTLPLSKPVVCVPFDNSLMLDVNLKATGTPERTKKGRYKTPHREDIRELIEINGKLSSSIGIGGGGAYIFVLTTNVCNVKQCGLSTLNQCKKTLKFLAGD